MRVWRERNAAPQWITSRMVVFDPTGVVSCFCFTVLSFSVVRFTPSACHSYQEMIVKFFALSIHLIAQFQSAVVVNTVIPRSFPGDSHLHTRVPRSAFGTLEAEATFAC